MHFVYYRYKSGTTWLRFIINFLMCANIFLLLNSIYLKLIHYTSMWFPGLAECPPSTAAQNSLALGLWKCRWHRGSISIAGSRMIQATIEYDAFFSEAVNTKKPLLACCNWKEQIFRGWCWCSVKKRKLFLVACSLEDVCAEKADIVFVLR